MSILAHVPPGFELRDNQPDILLAIEEHWDTNDIQVLLSDVGTGKSVVLQTIARWRESQGETVAVITPRVALQDQYKENFEGVPILKGSGRYRCKPMPDISCKEKKEMFGFYCKQCKYKQTRREAIESTNAVFNLQSYLLAKAPRDVLLVDEAHTLRGLLVDRYTFRMWQHKYEYPDGMEHYLDVLVWLEKARQDYQSEYNRLVKEIAAEAKHTNADADTLKLLTRQKLNAETELHKIEIIYGGMELTPTDFYIEHAMEEYKGVLKPLLKIRPLNLRHINTLFQKTTKKTILATATMHELDLDKLGISHKQHKFHQFDSPLEAEDRPIVPEFVGNMSYKYQEKNLPALAKKIEDLRERHSDTKGIVHMTYGLAVKLANLLDEDWVLWHTSDTREQQLTAFKEAPPGTVLIACGMSMGIDLAGPDFGWQALAKMPWPSQADPMIGYWYKNESKWVSWITAKEVLQASGRVNRYKGDYAVTYILDNNFGNPKTNQVGFYQRADKLNFWPEYFKKRIIWRGYEPKSRNQTAS